MKKSIVIISIALLLSACGSDESVSTIIATAEIGTTTDATATVLPDAESAATSDTSATPTAAAEDVTSDPQAATDSTAATAVVSDFLTAYQSDGGSDAAAPYFDDGLTDLYNGGKTVRTIVGVDPGFVDVQILNEAPYNDNQNIQVTAQLTYPAGAETVVVTVEQSESGWKVAAVAPNPQK